jgi:hypothetical protein
MLKFIIIIINLLFLKECLSTIQNNYTIINLSPPPASKRWIFEPKKNRTIRTFSFVDQCGGVGQNMLTPDQQTIFTVTSSSSNSQNYFNNSNLVLHALWSNNGTERWNISITDNNANYFKGTLFVSASNHYVIYGYSTGNNTFNLRTLNLNNGYLVWNKTIFVDSLALFRTISNNKPDESRIFLSPTTDWHGRQLIVLQLSTGNSINMAFPKAYPTGPIYFTTDLKSVFYNVGDGSPGGDIFSNWVSNGSSRILPNTITSGCKGSWLIGVDSSIVIIKCGTTCHINCPYDSSTNIFSLKTGQFLGGCQNGGGFGRPSSGMNWIQSIGDGQILYKSFSGSSYTITSATDKPRPDQWNPGTTPGSWILPTDSSDISFLPTVFLPNQGLILVTSLLSKYSTSSKLTAIHMNNGTTLWSREFSWSVIKKSGYEANFNVGTCGSSIYSLSSDNKTLILIDTHYNGHAISIQDGEELFNILLKITPDSYTNPYPPPNALSVVSNDAKTIYSIVPLNNGYIMGSYVGTNCDDTHYGQGCNKSCECIYKHGTKICDSGVLGTGQCSGYCDKHWTGNNCDQCDSNYYGNDCSNYMTCQVSGICDCGINGTGHCSSCYPRYKGIDCEDCTDEFYGKYCSKICTCKHGTNSSGINGTGHCQYCDDNKWSGIDCNLCYGKSDAPQCNTKYNPIDCLDPVNGKSIRRGCPSMCNSCSLLHLQTS